jgi:hypothetical protein
LTDPLTAATAAARDAGLPADDVVVIGDGANLNVHLRPAPVVARVSVTLVRGVEALETELPLRARPSSSERRSYRLRTTLCTSTADSM